MAWTVLGHYLSVRKWVLNFITSEAIVRLGFEFWKFLMQFYSEQCLQAIGYVVGRTVKN